MEKTIKKIVLVEPVGTSWIDATAEVQLATPIDQYEALIGVPVEIFVLDQDGYPAEGVNVTALVLNDVGSFTEEVLATDVTGSALFTFLPNAFQGGINDIFLTFQAQKEVNGVMKNDTTYSFFQIIVMTNPMNMVVELADDQIDIGDATTIHVTVTDPSNGEPLSGVQVQLSSSDSLEFGSTLGETSAQGSFTTTVEGLNSGLTMITVKCTHDGYFNASKDVSLKVNSRSPPEEEGFIPIPIFAVVAVLLLIAFAVNRRR